MTNVTKKQALSMPSPQVRSPFLESCPMHPRRVVYGQQPLSRFWGLGHDPASNVVDVYIRYLRKKLCNDLIHTVRVMGYRLG
jgi:DNA-binding response OmpR family regulator